MFKKLFISLLILSAVTSEGICALPANYAAFCIGSANEVSILAELNASACREQSDSNGRALLGNASSSNAFILTHNTKEKLKYNNSCLIYYETAGNEYLLHSSDLAGLQPEIWTENVMSFSNSGLSPPVGSNNIL